MIVKELGACQFQNTHMHAAHSAEERIATTLRHAFEDAGNVFVFNDLRLDCGGEAVEIDHLVLHRFGFIVIDSRSIHDSVEIDAVGQWNCFCDGAPRGISSPVGLGRARLDFLRKYLSHHTLSIFGRLFGLQADLAGRAYDLIVAVPDEGRVKSYGDAALPAELCMAGQVAERVRAIIDGYGGLRSVSYEGQPAFWVKDMESICRFLADHDQPFRMGVC
ncbi:nuclease-related domain-containing protein [Telmatospirillum sp. J64-1]|uniref:nuclease-related domain-containing protein n=1 Tax=Telmatospirillum sp. J64-1 TaxID=2502183 RepID=UPI00115C61A0|nr:nuclease-related domain-containing protein [Telmatospirillum sp. J64-1]